MLGSNARWKVFTSWQLGFLGQNSSSLGTIFELNLLSSHQLFLFVARAFLKAQTLPYKRIHRFCNSLMGRVPQYHLFFLSSMYTLIQVRMCLHTSSGPQGALGTPVQSSCLALWWSFPRDILGVPGQGLVSLWQGYWGYPSQLCASVLLSVWVHVQKRGNFVEQLPLLRCPWEQGAIWILPPAAVPLGSVVQPDPCMSQLHNPSSHMHILSFQFSSGSSCQSTLSSLSLISLISVSFVRQFPSLPSRKVR